MKTIGERVLPENAGIWEKGRTGFTNPYSLQEMSNFCLRHDFLWGNHKTKKISPDQTCQAHFFFNFCNGPGMHAFQPFFPAGKNRRRKTDQDQYSP